MSNSRVLTRNTVLEQKVNIEKDTMLLFGGKWIIYSGYDYAVSDTCIETNPCQHEVWDMSSNTYETLFSHEIAKLFRCSEGDLVGLHSYR
jgi:hypothetical protein